MTITTRSGKGSSLSHVEMDANLTELDGRTSAGWEDMLAPILASGLPGANTPTMTAFGPSGLRKELAFDINDYCFIYPLHVTHALKPSSQAYIHVHWTTDGTNVNTVKWQLEVMRAKGHDQANFGAPVTLTLEQAAAGTAWRHMIVEDTTGITLTEPDELILITLRRITNGGTNNTDAVFGLMCDVHFQVDRISTINKSPNFYA